jgi:putative hydrolase of the HAD superfamily
VEAYTTLARERELDAQRTWMVGNSPKSDINPALAAGLNAVYIPHPRTWGLEREEIQRTKGRLLVLENFAGLRQYF